MCYRYPQAFDLTPVKLQKIDWTEENTIRSTSWNSCITFFTDLFFHHLHHESHKSQFKYILDWISCAIENYMLHLKRYYAYYFTPPLFQYTCSRNNISNLTLLLIDLQFHKKEESIYSPRWTFWIFRVFSWCFSHGLKITVNHDPFALLYDVDPFHSYHLI